MSISAVKYLVAFLMAVSAMTMRPSLFGEVLTAQSLLILSVAFLIFAGLAEISGQWRVVRRNFVLAALVSIFWGYLALHAAILGINQSELGFAIKAFFSVSIIVYTYSFLLSDVAVAQSFFKLMISFFVLEIISYVITMFLLYVLGFGVGDISLWHVDTIYEDRGGWILFPFTATYGTLSVGDFTLFRLGGPFREAGIFQAFIVWAYLCLKDFEMNYRWVRITLLSGLILTMSTMGVAVFFACYLLGILVDRRLSLVELGRRLLLLGVGSVISILAFLYMPVFGLLEKMDTREDSFSDRSQASIDGFMLFLDNPIGTGMYNPAFENAGINLVAGTSEIGIIGVALIALILLYAIFSIGSWRTRMGYFIKIFPFLITALLTQPLLDAPLIFVMLMHDQFLRAGASESK